MSYNGLPDWYDDWRTAEPDYIEQPICPICGDGCDTYFKRDGDIIGCENCVKAYDAWEEVNEE